MAQMPLKLVTNQQSFQAGVDSSKVSTVASESNPNGLRPDQLAWLINGTVRRGGISPRPGWRRLAELPTAQFQDAFMYAPLDDYPYLISMIGGRIYQHRVDTDNSTVDLSAISGLTMPVTEKGFMVQGEEFLVIQAGDYVTLPLFWDGMNLVRSRGLTSVLLSGGTFTVPNIGQPTLVTGLANLYPPAPEGQNQIFTINGYRYQQVAYNQRYAATPNAYSLTCSLTGKSVTYAGGWVFGLLSGTGNGATLVAPVTWNLTAGSNPTTGPAVDAFFTSSSLTTGSFIYGSADYDFGGGCSAYSVRLSLAANPLAAPGMNEVWLINLDDPRAGTVVSIGQQPSQIPAAGPMDYYMGRLWFANGQEYAAGDIVKGPSGNGTYGFRDSILAVEENDYIAEGGTFAIPANAGNITALKHNANLDTSLGEGLLFVFTQQNIFSCNVPPTRAVWATTTEPLQRVAQINFGTTSDRSVAAQNGDLFYRSLDGIRSLIMAIRYFGQWANTPISEEEVRILEMDDPLLLGFTSSVVFDNRLLTTVLPVETDYGVAFKGIAPLDFDLVSSMRDKLEPAWEGVLEGLDIYKLVKGNFGGNERLFAFVRSRLTNRIELWEISKEEKEDTNSTGTNRITWILETPSYDWGNTNQLKELDTLRIWIDRLYGRADFTLYYRNDQNACWNFWNAWTECAARNDCENPGNENCAYPTQIYKQQYRAMMTMPRPPIGTCDTESDRPTTIGYTFQFRLVVKGYCRIRGIYAYAFPRDEQAYAGMVCIGDNPCSGCPPGAEGPQGADGARGAGMATYFGTAADPNGVISGNQGDAYKNIDTRELWIKTSAGMGNTGWQ